jgi:hypothetical protein
MSSQCFFDPGFAFGYAEASCGQPFGGELRTVEPLSPGVKPFKMRTAAMGIFLGEFYLRRVYKSLW